MMNLFRKFIPGSNFSSSKFLSLDEISDYKVEIFFFNVLTREWSESIPGSTSIEKLRKPETTFIAIKTESYPYNLIRKITRDFVLIQKDERTWMLRASMKAKCSDYKERNVIACRFSTTESARKFHNSIKHVQSTEKTGFENLNFRLEIIRRVHEKELGEKESALFANFPSWDDLLNGKYYQNFYSKGDSFHCIAEVREFDYDRKEWKELVLGTVKIEYLENTEQTILTVIEKNEFLRYEITSDVELIAIDDRTWMWRAYKKCEKDLKSLLIGCRFISSKVAKSFMESVIQVQEHAPSRCAFRDEYMSALFEKEHEIILKENQAALESNFPGEYEITELEDDPNPEDCLPSTSREDPLDIELTQKSNKFPKSVSSISLSSFSISSEKNSPHENAKREILSEYKAEFFCFNFVMKKWEKIGKGLVIIRRDPEIPKVLIIMKSEEEEEQIVSKITLDFQLIKKDLRSFIWRGMQKENMEFSLYMNRFENPEIAEQFKSSVKNIQDIYSSELSSDEFELEVLKKLYETESEENSTALVADFPSHVDLSWLCGSNISKLRINKEVSETHFSKGALFYSKADLYKFDINVREWRRLTALPGFVSINRKRFQEFQKTLIYAVTDEFQGRIIIKCEIGSNLDLKMKNKITWMWRGYVEIENGDLESSLIACRFSNSETARGFKKLVEDVQQQSPWRCFVRDEFSTGLLKKASEKIAEENEIALNSNLQEDLKEVEKNEISDERKFGLS